MKRALNAGVPAYVVDPELFPNMTSHSMAIANPAGLPNPQILPLCETRYLCTGEFQGIMNCVCKTHSQSYTTFFLCIYTLYCIPRTR